jgi:putative ABC transport system substrate-binding protein
MKRRHFISLTASAAAWPLTARAQRGGPPIVGYLSGVSAAASAPFLAALRQGLAETGFVEGRNVAIDYRWADGDYGRLPELAASLARRPAAVVFANNPAAPAAKAATSTIPVVFVVGVDPVATGLVASLNHPGANVTGVTSLNVEIGPKRMQILREMVPAANLFGVLINPRNPNADTLAREAQAAARTLGVQARVLHAGAESDFEGVFAELAKSGAGGLVIGADALFNACNAQLAALSLRHAMPAITQYRDFAVAGGLMAYGGNVTELYRRAAVYVGRILKGDKPADLPVQQVTNVELVLNLKTAKALGLTVPLPLLGRADEVIE